MPKKTLIQSLAKVLVIPSNFTRAKKTWNLKLITQEKRNEDEMLVSRYNEAQQTCFCVNNIGPLMVIY